jgi:hypothetical protein
MPDAFLENLLYIARSATRAERGMAVDQALNLLDRINLDDAVLESPQFIDMASSCLRRAIEDDEAIITNNVVPDASQAPTTNTNFSDLRMIVVLPVTQRGAIYLDRPVRQGLIYKENVDALMLFARQALTAGLEEAPREQLLKLFREMTTPPSP